MPLVTPEPGLCLDCANSRRLPGARSTFWLCELSARDPSFPRYPRLPVLACRGFERLNGPPDQTTVTRP